MADGHGNDIATINVSENYVNDIKSAIKSIRKEGKRPDNDSISEFVLNNFATNVDQVFIESCITSLIKRNILRNKPTPKGNSYFIVEEKPTEEEKEEREEDITDEFDIEKVAMNFETPLVKDISKKGNMNETYAELLALKNFTMDEIYTLKMKVDGIEAANKCHQSRLEEEIIFLRDENSSKSFIIKSLLENLSRKSQSSMTVKNCSNDVINLTKNLKNHEIESTNFNNTQDDNYIEKVNYPEQQRYQHVTNRAHGTSVNSSWKTVARSDKNAVSRRNRNIQPNNLDVRNTFTPLYIQDQDQNDINQNDINNNIQEYHETNKYPINIVKNRKPEVCTTENHLRNFTPITTPGNSSYASTARAGRKIFIVGDSHIRRVRRNDFNNELKYGKAFFRSFSGANVKQLNHYLEPTLIDDKPDAILIHVGTNDIVANANPKEIANNIINTGLKCRSYGVNNVFISSILVKKNPSLNIVIRHTNDLIRDLCERNGLCYINNDIITTDYLWKDGIHLKDTGTHILSSNFSKHMNRILFNISNDII